MKTLKSLNPVRLVCGTMLSMFLFSSCGEEDLVKPSVDIVSKSDTNNTEIEPCAQVCLVAGQHDNVGSVDVAVADNGNLLVTYKLTKASVYLAEVHVDIFSSLEQFQAEKKLSSGGASPGKFAFSESWGSTSTLTTYTVEIPKAYVDSKSLGNNCFFIASHAALTNDETAWGGMCDESANGASLYNAKQFPGKNWGVFFDFCLDNCNNTLDFTYAWEDKKDEGNDGDYNDFIVQSGVSKSSNTLNIDFLATARGAHYEHQFKIKVPKQGIVGGIEGIIGEDAAIELGDSYIITVFNGTKSVLPGNGSGFANTENGSCERFASANIKISIDETFNYNPEKPFLPFISVFTNGVIDELPDYDLSIYELTFNPADTWTMNGKRYPNGLLIPRDWKWPLERVFIANPYPDFKSITDGFDYNWANNLVYPSYTFDASSCNGSL